ncbi:MAG: molecular chaperone DnaJ [Nanoarchaeota archaeon]|nr:molecular chaperone DnaJ [Nanoarchaeota archaeon]
MTKRDYYEILGINKSSSKEEIKKAYKKLALKFHPDRNKEAGAEDKFKEISEAYAVLSDDEKRSAYNQFGHSGFDQRFSQEDIFRNFDFSQVFKEFGFGGESFGDSIFDMFFGGSRTRRKKASDLRYDIEISFEEAAFGTKKTIRFHKNVLCDECNGTGAKDGKLENCKHCQGTGQIRRIQRTMFGVFQQVMPCKHCDEGKIAKAKCSHCDNGLTKEEKTLTVNIPAGVDNNSRIRVAGEGEETKHDKGDLYIILHVQSHKLFDREENDLYTSIEISFPQAALGTEIEIPLLKGETKIKIPEGTQSDTIFRLKDKGVKHLNHNYHGDLFVKVKVKTPEKISKKEKDLYSQLAKLKKEKITLKKGFFEKVKEYI